MATNCNNGKIKIESIVLDDGRKAERHIQLDDLGCEIVEIFAEEKRPLKLEKRIVREYKNIVSKETHETVNDGEVAHVEVRSLEPEVPLQVRERIGLANHAKIVDGDYIKKEEIGPLVAESVVTGIRALMENMEPVQMQKTPAPAPAPAPLFKAQTIVENNVAEKKKFSLNSAIWIALIVVQAAVLVYMLQG